MAQSQYDLLHELSRQVLHMFLENRSEESTQSFLTFLCSLGALEEKCSLDVLKRQVLLGFAHWINLRIRSLDALVPAVSRQITANFRARMSDYVASHASSQDDSSNLQIMRDFTYFVVLQLLGSEFSCFANALAVLLESPLTLAESPVMLVSHLVNHLEHCRAKVIQVALELDEKNPTGRPGPLGPMGPKACKDFGKDITKASELVMQFCRHFTVKHFDAQNPQNCLLEHEACTDAFQQSPFSIKLIDSYGSLLMMLQHVERLRESSNLVIAVDFEGVKLNRSGQLCLVQIAFNDIPSRVYVLDVYVLPRSMHLETPNGTSLKGLLEDWRILKIWFDPRNDVDALFHQFGIVPQHVFDLQLAEVATRRSKGLQVNFVPSLQKCLSTCDQLDVSQRTFADWINKTGKQLFEPDHGGCYEIFQQRPLLDQILLYAAHDCRYMQLLYSSYRNLSTEWFDRILAASQIRAQWFAHREYLRPSTDAPDF